jgi:hypothetical protein
MYLQEILEVAIGLVFVWLVVSMATMSLQEWLGNMFNLRANDLAKVIGRMLGNAILTRRFYDYPLITNLYANLRRSGRKGRLPANIPPSKFSATLFELISQAGLENSPVQKMTGEIQDLITSNLSPEQQKSAWVEWNVIQETARNITASDPATNALDSLRFKLQAFAEKYSNLQPAIDNLIPLLESYYGQLTEEQNSAAEPGANNGTAMSQFRLGMQALQETNPTLNESMTAIYRQTEVYSLNGDEAVASTHANLESWFNDAMDQLSGAYKRRAQVIAFGIGLFLALILNLDSVNLATNLWREPTLRQAIIAQAQNYTPVTAPQGSSSTSPFENIPTLETQLQVLNIPFGWTFIPLNTGGGQCSLLPIQAGQVWGIPTRNSQGVPVCSGIQNLPIELNDWLAKILGLLITALAAAQGAPFWFDVLKRFLNVNSASTKTAEQKTTA